MKASFIKKHWAWAVDAYVAHLGWEIENDYSAVDNFRYPPIPRGYDKKTCRYYLDYLDMGRRSLLTVHLKNICDTGFGESVTPPHNVVWPIIHLFRNERCVAGATWEDVADDDEEFEEYLNEIPLAVVMVVGAPDVYYEYDYIVEHRMRPVRPAMDWFSL